MRKNLDGVKPSTARPIVAVRPSRRPVPEEYRSLRKPRNNRASCLWFLFLLFAAAVAGFYFWNQRPTVKVDNSLSLSVNGPSEIVSGDQAIYVVKYKNLDVVDLQKMELSVKWPNGFYFDEASKEARDINATTWNLPDLKPNEEATLEIRGQLVGNKDEQMSANFILQYQPANFSSDFNASQTVDTKIKDSKLTLSIEGVDKTLINTEQEFKVKYKNLTTEAISGLFLDILYPDDLEIKSVEPAKEGDYWVVDLQAAEEKIVTIKGIFGPDSRADQQLVAEVGSQVNDKFRRLSRAEKDTAVISPKFTINLQINNRTDNHTVNWGDTLQYQLDLTNDSETDLSDVKISALLDGTVLDWETLETVGRQEGNSVIWTRQEDGELASWPKGKTKQLTWKINVVKTPQPERMIDNIIKLNIEGLSGWEQLGTAISLTVGESISFNGGVYYDLAGRRVGSGILPPRVGVETSYLVVWSLTEQTGDFKTVKVESTLPPNVKFLEETDVQEGSLSFSEDDRNLVWDLSNFSNIILPVTASFMIEITPSQDDQGKAMTLLNSSTVTAKGIEEVRVRSKVLKTSDVVSASKEPVGIVQ